MYVTWNVGEYLKSKYLITFSNDLGKGTVTFDLLHHCMVCTYVRNVTLQLVSVGSELLKAESCMHAALPFPQAGAGVCGSDLQHWDVCEHQATTGILVGICTRVRVWVWVRAMLR